MLAPGQGFFVNSNVASTSVTFTKAMQSDQNGVTFYKNTDPKITLLLYNGINTKSTEINYLDGKTTGLDPRFEIGTFTGQSSSLDIYTHLVSDSEGVNFKKQALPNSDYENMIIPVGINSETGKEITFSLETSNLPSGIKVFLEDKLTNTFTRLDENESNYKITLLSNSHIGRFYIHTKSSALNIDSNLLFENVSIYKTNNTTLRIAGLQSENASIKLFNVLGKQVLSTSFKSKGISEITLPKLVKGVYIVQLQTENGKLNKKIILE